MEKTDVSSLLGGLEPTTEYAEFLKLWPDITEARARQVKLKTIYEALLKEKLLTISYVTFTRFVKKKVAEGDSNQNAQRPAAARKAQSSVSDPGLSTQDSQSEALPEAVASDTSDKSDRIATESNDALQEALQVSTQKNYSKNVRNR